MAASFYEDPERIGTLGRGRASRQLQVLRSVPRPLRGGRMLDVGCGDGRLASATADAASARFAIGVDISATALGSVDRSVLAPVQALLDSASLPFRNSSFDLVAMSEVLEHLADTDTVMREIRRVLSSDGTLLITTPNLAAWFNRVLLGLGHQPVFSEVSYEGIFGRPGKLVVGHLRLFTERALVGFLHHHGFDVIDVSGTTYDDVPWALRWLDRLAQYVSSLAAILIVTARPRQPTND